MSEIVIKSWEDGIAAIKDQQAVSKEAINRMVQEEASIEEMEAASAEHEAAQNRIHAIMDAMNEKRKNDCRNGIKAINKKYAKYGIEFRI